MQQTLKGKHVRHQSCDMPTSDDSHMHNLLTFHLGQRSNQTADNLKNTGVSVAERFE